MILKKVGVPRNLEVMINFYTFNLLKKIGQFIRVFSVSDIILFYYKQFFERLAISD